jgi:hypothetical protein
VSPPSSPTSSTGAVTDPAREPARQAGLALVTFPAIRSGPTDGTEGGTVGPLSLLYAPVPRGLRKGTKKAGPIRRGKSSRSGSCLLLYVPGGAEPKHEDRGQSTARYFVAARLVRFYASASGGGASSRVTAAASSRAISAAILRVPGQQPELRGVRRPSLRTPRAAWFRSPFGRRPGGRPASTS